MKQNFLPKLALGILIAFFYTNTAHAQCRVRVLTNDTSICNGDVVTAVATVLDTVTTTLADDNGQSGNMFDVVAKNNITVRAFDAHIDNGTNFSIYYKTGSYKNTERDSTKWKLLGRVFGVTAAGNGSPTRIPFYFSVDIKKGDTTSFYVTSTTSNTLNYTNGSSEYAVYSADKNLSVLEGLGVMWPFGGSSTSTGIYRPRIFNGNIIYEPTGTKSFKWNNNMTGDTIVFTPSKTFELKVTATIGACTSVDSVDIEVENYTVELGNDTFICEGYNIQLDGGNMPTGSVYNWKPGGIGNRYKLISGGGEKSISVTTPKGCLYRDTIDIIEIKTPIVALGNDIDLCDGDSIELDAGDFGTKAKYSWSTNDTLRKITVTKEGRYVARVTDEYGCVGKDNIDLTLRQNPNINLGGHKEVCEGDTIELDAGFVDNNTIYNWSGNQTTKTIKITTTNGYKVLVTSEYGCKGQDSVYYLFHGKPTSGISGTLESCRGNDITLDAGYHGPKSKYEWSTTETTQSIIVSENGAYSVLITDSFGCTNTETITTNFRKLPKVNLGLDINFCEGQTETLNAGFDDGYTTYNWNTSETTKSIDVSETGTYSVTVIDSFGCENSDEIEVLVIELPNIKLIADTSVCEGETIVLDAGSHNKYKWSTNENSQTITVGAGDYDVTVTNIFGCKNSASVSIGTVANAIAAFVGNDIGSQKIEFANNSTNANKYRWDFGDGNSSTDAAPTHWYKQDGSYTVKLTASNRCNENENETEVTVTASGIDNSPQGNILLYPNPTQGDLFVTYSGNANINNVLVYTVSGQVIKTNSKAVSENTIKILLPNALSKGIYVAHLVTDKGIILQNFIVE
ncbi:MAG: PKD domain-containing protein [Bacteroidia bacterium]